MAKNDDRLDRVEWLISKGRYDDANRLLGRTIDQLHQTDVGWKLTVRVPDLQRKLTDAAVGPRMEGGGFPSGAVQRAAVARVEELLVRGDPPEAVKNQVADELGLMFGIDDESRFRGRLFAKVATAVERWTRDHGLERTPA